MMNRLNNTAALIVLLSGALLLWSSGRSLAADAVDFVGTSSTHSTLPVGEICPDKYAFVTGLQTTGIEQLTKIAFSCVRTLQDASWDPAGPQALEFDQVPSSPGVTTDRQCPTGLYAVGFDFSLVERTEQNSGPLGPTLHIMAPAHLRLICSNPRASQYGNAVLQDRRTCPAGQAVTGL